MKCKRKIQMYIRVRRAWPTYRGQGQGHACHGQTRGCGKRSFRDRGKLEAWQALISTAWQIKGMANLGRGKLEAWQT